MIDLYLNIADVTFLVRGKIYDYFRYRVRDYICEKTENPDVVINICDSEKITVPECTLIKKSEFRYYCENDDWYINYDLMDDNSCTALMEIKKDGKEVNCTLLDVEDLGGASLSVRSFNMVGESIRHIMILNSGLCIHSSSLAYLNNGVLFSAPSGTGKSTHTKLWQKVFNGVEIINDDMPVVKNIDGIWHLCGAPWSGKTEFNVNKKVPLKGIVFLERGKANEIEEIKAPECVLKLLSQTTLPVYKKMTENVMQSISSLVGLVPIYLLKCNISDEAPITVAKKLGLI